ncbi:adenylate/guanylate cyclase domain-containing protein [Winogradskyella sp. PE311]|uniref:adenylate/guanylate cyclase domain-containing protein n=1 Tax=Winogradskyella sp. PE311 TaxID=3366943 RepID=UPI00397EC58E
MQYDVWRNTVNTAARMEISRDIRKFNISNDIYNLTKNNPDFKFESRGKIEATGKGTIQMFFVKKV